MPMENSVPPISLPFLGWFFLILSAVVLALGLGLLRYLHLEGKLQQRYEGYSLWNDILLLGIWIMGFTGGLGVINGKAVGGTILEYFCAVMIVLVVVNSLTRIKTLKQRQMADPGAPPFNWAAAIAGALFVVVPVVALCAGAIYTLRGELAQQMLR
jgi:hypothetical protein